MKHHRFVTAYLIIISLTSRMALAACSPSHDASTKKTADPDRIVVMISVDGERDSPAVMKSFLAPVSPTFIGLTGEPAAVRDIAAQFSAVFFKGAPDGTARGYQVEHTSLIYLADSAGRLRASFVGAPAADIAETVVAVAAPERPRNNNM